MKILVTGSQGLIGSAVVPTLLEAGHDVVTFDRQESSASIPHVVGDTRDLEALAGAAAGVDRVLHLGAVTSAPTPEILDIAIRGMTNVLLAAERTGSPPIVHLSSINAMGVTGPDAPAPDFLPVDEVHPRRPRTAYQIAKHTAEELADSFAAAGRASVTHLRPTLVTTPEKHYAEWRSDPGTRERRSERDLFAYVDRRDVVDAILRAAALEPSEARAYLLSAPDTTSNDPTAALIERYWPGLNFDETRLIGTHQSLIDCSRAHDELGWTPRHSWRDASQ